MFFSILGIVVVLFLLFKFGISALINFSLFLSGKGGEPNSTNSQNTINFLPSPVLNPIVSATNSAQIIITGISQKDRKIELFLNSRKIDETDTADNGEFRFEPTLKKGTNTVSVRAVYKDKKSDASEKYIVEYKDTAPKLEVSSPSDQASFKKEDKSVEIKGQTDANVTVTVNGFFAVTSENNSFSYVLQLHDGDNEVNILAVDNAGNKSEKTIKVNYSP